MNNRITEPKCCQITPSHFPLVQERYLPISAQFLPHKFSFTLTGCRRPLNIYTDNLVSTHPISTRSGPARSSPIPLRRLRVIITSIRGVQRSVSRRLPPWISCTADSTRLQRPRCKRLTYDTVALRTISAPTVIWAARQGTGHAPTIHPSLITT